MLLRCLVNDIIIHELTRARYLSVSLSICVRSDTSGIECTEPLSRHSSRVLVPAVPVC